MFRCIVLYVFIVLTLYIVISFVVLYSNQKGGTDETSDGTDEATGGGTGDGFNDKTDDKAICHQDGVVGKAGPEYDTKTQSSVTVVGSVVGETAVGDTAAVAETEQDITKVRLLFVFCRRVLITPAY